MSNSTEIGDAGRFSGFKPARAAEKSSTFSQTCSLLSHYLKEKKTLGDLSLGMNNTNSDGNGMTMMMMMPDTFRQTAATTTTTMNLFPMGEKSDEATTTDSLPKSRNIKSMDLFPQQSGFAPKAEVVVQEKVTNSQQQQQPETAEMTIFYNGQVIVFNDFPAEKAKQVMVLASKESSQTSLPVQKPIEETCINRIPTSSSVVSNLGNINTIQEHVVPQPKPQSAVTAIPIARKASLTRFLEKRKDRITTRAPYLTSSAKACPQKPAESKSWLGLAAQYPVQFGHQL